MSVPKDCGTGGNEDADELVRDGTNLPYHRI